MDDPSEGSSTQITSGKVIGGKFKLEDKIGQGSFGMIFKCINIESQELCAIKLEKRNQRHSSMLVREIKVMMEVKNEKGFARLNGYGKEEDYNYVAMTYLGRNLDSLLRKCGGKFKLQCLLNTFEQTLIRVQTLHNKNLIHRDIKPENFVIGYGSNFNQIHLIDFGLAKYYIDSEGNHIPFFEKKGMIGTARYASVNAHLGHEQSRRDDLEGLGYIILYFAKGSLPWQAIHAENKEEKYEKIKQMKLTISLDQLCSGLPLEFSQYFQHVKNLEFNQKPNYDYLFKLIDKMRTDNNIETNINIVDWQELPEYRPRKKYQTFTPHTVQQYQKQKLDEVGGGSPRGYLQRSSDQLQKPPQRVQRKAQHNHTNLLQIPDKNNTFLIQPSVSNISANTSKVNNFQAGSYMAGAPDKFGTGKITSSTKINSFADIEKYEEEKRNSYLKLNKGQSQSTNKIDKYNQHSYKNGRNSPSKHQQQQQSQQIDKNSSKNISIKLHTNLNDNANHNNDNQNTTNNNNKNSHKENDETEKIKSQHDKQQLFYQVSDNMQTGSQDYHKQYPINNFVAKKSYKNGNFP